ncbi:hypothetical protein SARC_07206 [Sphaeroforma arctica JP610]|uniref:RCK C-terminal domain-containing protein n=1 Tax=Sphaeroforma arctica JP610 TaxID=667725 RepID=A0A0L0FUB1_9EUKA|nr:hypothetical protein SARC_07206 [Sphaeroforma arctica JP610]KNC80435.1 hypothetical protein SARC_07206 [Sphaeroforma arctica JP610]|eukprot:XP_014154337.1 hypothetical protein SARC_07206 [Sphaeroforma arctica JP610]
MAGELDVGEYTTYETVIVGIALVATVILLLSQKLEPHTCFLIPIIFIILFGGATINVILEAFSDTTVFTIALLLVIGHGLAKAGLDDILTRHLLPKTGSVERCITVLCVFVPMLSGFMYNSAVVAVLIPTLIRWAVGHNRGVGKLMIPLSYASVLGGTCTMIGSSTNLVANNISGLNLGTFDITPLGLSVLGFGVLYLMFFSHRLLPENKISLPEDDDADFDDIMSYAVRFEIPDGHFLVGKTANEVGLYDSAELQLKRVDHNDGTCAFPLRPSTTFRVGDTLTFAGSLERLVSVKCCYGLVKLAPDQHQGSSGRLFEVVIADVGPSLDTFGAYRDRLRKEYSALILQVYRGGTLIVGNVEQLQLPLMPRDLLIVESDERFLELAENSQDFSLVVQLGIKATKCETCGTKVETKSINIWLIAFNTVIFAGAIVLNIFVNEFARILLGVVTIQIASLVITFGTVGSVFLKNAKVLMTIMGALGLAAAMQTSGLTTRMADVITTITADLSEILIYLVFYLFATLLSSFINNNAAVALLLPILRDSSIAETSYYTQVVYAVLMGASHSFMLPSGDKTSLMVMGPGRYDTKNYAKTGFPLQIIGFAVTICVLYFYEQRWFIAIFSVLVGLLGALYAYVITSAEDSFVQSQWSTVQRRLRPKRWRDDPDVEAADNDEQLQENVESRSMTSSGSPDTALSLQGPPVTVVASNSSRSGESQDGEKFKLKIARASTNTNMTVEVESEIVNIDTEGSSRSHSEASTRGSRSNSEVSTASMSEANEPSNATSPELDSSEEPCNV